MQVDNLKKVTFSLRIDGGLAQADLKDTPVVHEFIYGVASEGVCPFEMAFADKVVGEVVSLTILRTNAREMCAHLLQPLRKSLGIHSLPESMSLEMEVVGVEVAENREVIQAMSQSLGSSGCGGDCDCGCG